MPMISLYRSLPDAVRRLLRVSSAAALALCLAVPAQAASVLELSVETMLAKSALVVEAQVVNVDASARHPGVSGTDPWTAVTLRVTDVIKRSPGAAINADRTLTLYFLGGTGPDGLTLSVPGMQVPASGSSGVFFIKDPGRPRVHPLYGWSQGEFRLEADSAGIRRVHTQLGEPVLGVSYAPPAAPGTLSEGTARGVVLARARRNAVSASQFKRQLRGMMSRGVTR